MTHPIDEGLRSLGVDPDKLDPVVLSEIRAAKDRNVTDQATDALAAAFDRSRRPITLETQEPTP